jgi:D-glycero-D-manno-heptose 1,7-bisphosphate phosphatase
MPPFRPAVFLDRDGTVIEERGYIDRLDLVALFPWTADAIRLLNRAGFATVVVTNQAAIGRGIITEEFLQEIHATIDARLGRARIDRYYYCPHFPEATEERYRRACECRKPAPGMILRACRELHLDPARSFMVGDRWLDVACGTAAGARAQLVRTGHGAHEEERGPGPAGADGILDNLMEAVGWILRSSSPSSAR